MKVKPLNDKVTKILNKHQLLTKYNKQKAFLEEDINYPSLSYELLKETKDLPNPLYSFRINQKYRAICLLISSDLLEVIAVSTSHYKDVLK